MGVKENKIAFFSNKTIKELIEKLDNTDMDTDVLDRLKLFCMCCGYIAGTLLSLIYTAEVGNAFDPDKYNQ